MAESWLGWTVEFWGDDWTRHVRAAAGRFQPPPADPVAALAEIRQEALERWSSEREGWLRELMGTVAGADPGAGFGRGFLVELPDGLTEAAGRAVELATRPPRDSGDQLT